MLNKLTNIQLMALDQKLSDYPHIDRKIAIRKLELQSFINQDRNIEDGKDNILSKTTGTMEHWNTDIRLNGLEHFKTCVEKTIEVLDDELKVVFNLRWGRSSAKTWEEIANEIHVSKKSIYRKRGYILTIFADFRGDL